MNISTYILMQKSRKIWPVFFILAIYLFVAALSLQEYLPIGSLQFILGLPALSFALHRELRGTVSHRFGWVALLFILLCCWLPVSTFLYFALSFSILYLLECTFGKTGFIPVVMLVLISPAFNYVANTISWPLRLELTQIAGSFFSATGIDTITRGNVIIQGNNEFSIDPGCMGLSMMAGSLLFGALVLTWFQHRLGRSVKGVCLLLFFGAIILMNIIANLFRIIFLVYFSIPPETFGHDLAGIACLLPYVFYPSVRLAEFLVKRGRLHLIESGLTGKLNARSLIKHGSLLAILIALAFLVNNADTYKIKEPLVKQINGYQVAPYEPGITKLSNPQSLIYIKHIRGFYDTDHNPMICWKGSGYVPDHTEKRFIGNATVYTAWLINGKERLYTAWWYSNGKDAVTSQFAWRWNMLGKKQNYALVNVTCSSMLRLEGEIKKLKELRVLEQFIRQ